MTYSQNLQFPKYQLRAAAERIAADMNVHLDADATKEELANWLAIMEPHYEDYKVWRAARNLPELP